MAENPPSSNLYVSDLPVGMDETAVKQLFSQYGVVESAKVIPAKFPNSPVHALVKFASLNEAQWLCENLNNNIPEGLSTPVQVKYAKHSGQFGGDTPGTGKPPMGGGMAMGKGGGGFMKGGAAAPWAGGIAAPYRSQPYGGKGDGFGGDDAWGGKGGKGESQIESLYQALGVAGVYPVPHTQHATYVANLPPDTEDIDLLRIFSPFGAIPATNGIKAMREPDGTCKGIAFVNFTHPQSVQAACSTLNGALLPSGTTLVVKPKAGDGNGMEAPAAKGFAKGGGGGGYTKGSNPPKSTGETFQGQISGYREGSFFCFISCPEVVASYGKDPFCPAAALRGDAWQNGETVEFDLGVGGDGQPKVMNVRKVAGGQVEATFNAM